MNGAFPTQEIGQYLEVLDHVPEWTRVVDSHALLDHRRVAGPDTKGEPISARALDGQGLLRQRDGVARERGHHPATELDALRPATRQREQGQGVPIEYVSRPCGVEAQRIGLGEALEDRVEGSVSRSGDVQADTHVTMISGRGAHFQKMMSR